MTGNATELQKMDDNRSVLITGGTGFIGIHLASDLRLSGANVHLLLRKESNIGAISDQYRPSNLHLYDGTTQSLIDTLRQVRPCTVFHLASAIVAEHRPTDVEQLLLGNIVFGSQLLEAMKETETRRLVNTGTFWQHYQSNAERPNCLYAATKRAYQDIIDFYADAYGIRAVTIKLFDTYGPNDRRHKLFSVLRRAAETGEVLAMSEGEQQMDLVYLDDVLAAFRIAEARVMSDTGTGHESFGAPSGKPHSLKNVVAQFEDVFSRKLKIQWGGRPYRSREVMTCWNGHPILPGWKSKIDLLGGLRNMLAIDGPIGGATFGALNYGGAAIGGREATFDV